MPDRETLGRLAGGKLIHETRQLVQAAADEHVGWIRDNFRTALEQTKQDASIVSALTGVAPATVRGFLEARGTSIANVAMMALAIGFTLGDLDKPPREFATLLSARKSAR